MPKSKSKSKKQVSAPAPTPVEVVSVPTPTPVEVVSVPTPTPVEVVSAPTPVEVTASAVVVPSVDDDFKSLMTRFSELRSLTSSLISEAKRLSKRVDRELKEAERHNRRRRKNKSTTKRAPSGFAKPAAISEELCDFLNCDHGTQMARTEVTKFLTQYIKKNDLQDPSNRRRILCDTALSELLSVGPEDEVTYFNLQKYMKPHFPKSEVSA